MFEINIPISRPPNEVFAALARIEDAPLWYSAVRRVDRLDPEPVGLGSHAQFIRDLAGTTVKNEVEVSEFEPDRRITLSSVSGPTPFTYRYELTPTDDGTLLRLEGSISGDGLPGALGVLRPLAETFFKRGMGTNLAALKRLIEDG